MAVAAWYVHASNIQSTIVEENPDWRCSVDNACLLGVCFMDASRGGESAAQVPCGWVWARRCAQCGAGGGPCAVCFVGWEVVAMLHLGYWRE